MRTAAVVLCLAVAAVPAARAQQERSEPRTPKKGDTVVVKGCLRGGSLESTETSIADDIGTSFTALVFRLTGDKATLKKMRDDHNGELVEVTGELKSTLPAANERRGRQFGRTRVYIGTGSQHVGATAEAEASRSIPVLQVKSYEGHAVQCAH
jgi:hypothetical protein